MSLRVCTKPDQDHSFRLKWYRFESKSGSRSCLNARGVKCPHDCKYAETLERQQNLVRQDMMMQIARRAGNIREDKAKGWHPVRKAEICEMVVRKNLEVLS